jgi:hypothetical protein
LRERFLIALNYRPSREPLSRGDFRVQRIRPLFLAAGYTADSSLIQQEHAMSIFGNIMSAIFKHSSAQAQPTAPGSGTTAGAKVPGGPAKPAGSADASGAKPAASPMSPQSQVDVEAVLSKLASQNKEKLDWRKSIVDLMKLLKLDSSLRARQELAKELHYSGDTKDSAAMNVWLHKQVMIKLAENGGKVPADLRH